MCWMVSHVLLGCSLWLLPWHVLINIGVIPPQVAKQGAIQQLASSAGSGFVISGSQGVTQVPQAVLHQVAVDTGLVQVPQPSTPPQAPPTSVRQVTVRDIFLPVFAALRDVRDLLPAASEWMAQACVGLQVSCIEGDGIATAAALTAQALGQHRGTAASSAGPASRYSEIQSAIQQTGGDHLLSSTWCTFA